MPKVSVIIPCYNQGKYIDETVDSVLNQTFQDFEIVIVNDGSTDKVTNEILENYNKPKTTVIHTENRGVSSARNTAIKASVGEYILPLDGDDKLHKDFLKLALEAFNRRPELKLVYSEVDFFGFKEGRWHLASFDMAKMLLSNQIVSTAMYRRLDYNKTKGYNVNMKKGLEDWDFWLTLLSHNREVYRIPKTLFYYRMVANSRNNVISEQGLNDLRYQVFLNHTNLYQKYYGNPITSYSKNLKLEESLFQIKNSISYKFCLSILKPLKFILKKMG